MKDKLLHGSSTCTNVCLHEFQTYDHISNKNNLVVYRFNTVSNLFVYGISEVVLIHLFMTKTKKSCFDISVKPVVPGCHPPTSVVVGKRSAAQLVRNPAGGLLNMWRRNQGKETFKILILRVCEDYLRVSVWVLCPLANLKTVLKTLQTFVPAMAKATLWLVVALTEQLSKE